VALEGAVEQAGFGRPASADVVEALAARGGRLPTAGLVPRLAALLAGSLRPDVHYVTVCQRPAGPWLSVGFIAPLANTLVLSAGGNGHVPIPLLARELPFLPVRGAGGPPPPHPFERAAVPPFGAAPVPLTFFGASREGTREKALRLLSGPLGGGGGGGGGGGDGAVGRKAAGRPPAPARLFSNGGLLPRSPAAWVPLFANTTLALAPRGVGATSFRLFEALQLGVPPVYVYSGLPWLPYHPPTRALGAGWCAAPAAAAAANPPRPHREAHLSWERVAHVVELGALGEWAARELPRAAAAGGRGAWEAAREEMARVRESHFTYEGVMRHIFRWLADPSESELYCTVAVRPGNVFY
jgi:hypothetical protein